MPRKAEINPESSPAARFGYELRTHRQSAGMSQDKLGASIGYTGATVSAIELGKHFPRLDFARKCDDALRLAGALTRLWAACKSDGAQRWFLPWLDSEQTAKTLHSWEPSLIPGLLQTADYARALFAGAPGMTPKKTDQAVAARIERQGLFDREEPPMMWAVLDEGVLQRRVGGPEVMTGQLEHLLTMSEHPCIALQIVPLDSSCTAGLSGAFMLARVQDQDVAYLDSADEGVVTASTEAVQRLRLRYDSIRLHALPQDASHNVIKEWLEKWKSRV